MAAATRRTVLTLFRSIAARGAEPNVNATSEALAALGTTPRRFSSAQPATAIEEDAEFPQFCAKAGTIGEILAKKGQAGSGAWLFCATTDTVYDAVKQMTANNVGALLVMRPTEDQRNVAGIVTERDYLRKIIVQGRSSKTTKVGDIMTEENRLVTVTPDTTIFRAMELMTDNRFRHIPVVSAGSMLGMVSIGDVMKAVVEEHRSETKKLNEFIAGTY